MWIRTQSLKRPEAVPYRRAFRVKPWNEPAGRNLSPGRIDLIMLCRLPPGLIRRRAAAKGGTRPPLL